MKSSDRISKCALLAVVGLTSTVFLSIGCSPKKKVEPKEIPAKDITIVDPRAKASVSETSDQIMSIGNVWIESQFDSDSKKTTVFLKAAFHKAIKKNVFLASAPVHDVKIETVAHDEHEDHNHDGGAEGDKEHGKDHDHESTPPKTESKQESDSSTPPAVEEDHEHDHDEEKGAKQPQPTPKPKQIKKKDGHGHAH